MEPHIVSFRFFYLPFQSLLKISDKPDVPVFPYKTAHGLKHAPEQHEAVHLHDTSTVLLKSDCLCLLPHNQTEFRNG